MDDAQISLLNRRNFLKLSLAGLGASALGLYAFGQQGGAVDYADPAYRYWQKRTPGSLALENYLVMCAALAPSAHNTQPWKFAVRDRAITVYADFQRSLGQADPAHRMKLLSVGCALENIRIAAADLGFAAQINVADAGQFAADQRCADIRLVADNNLSQQPLFQAMFQRQTTRAAYLPQAVPAALQARLAALNDFPQLNLRWFDSPADLTAMAGLNTEACIAFTRHDAAYLDSLKWWRYSRNELLRKRDGISIFTSAAPAVIKQYFQYGVSAEDMAGAFGKNGEIDLMQQLFAATPLWGVISAKRVSLQNRLQAGQLFERLFLQATDEQYKMHAINYVTESADYAEKFKRRFDIVPDDELLLVFRMGQAPACEKSVRRPLADIIV